MNNVLLINASPNGQVSHANQLALELVASLRHRYPRLELVERDLGTHPLPPLGMDYARGLATTTPFDSPAFEVSEALISELERSDILLIATPMHNFTLPASLKLWIDYVLRIHRTFSSGPEGKAGLLSNRPVYVLVGSGGFHQGERARQPDFLTPYLRQVLNTLGCSTCTSPTFKVWCSVKRPSEQRSRIPAPGCHRSRCSNTSFAPVPSDLAMAI